MKPVYDVLVIARRLFCDLVFIGLPNPPRPGQEVFAQGMHASAGGAFNVAAALQRLGLRVGLVADIGDDFFSRFVCEQLASERLDDSLVRWHKEPLATVTVALPWNGDRAFVSYIESKAFPPFGPELLDHCQARHLHCSGLEEAIVELELLRAARARGMTISIDCQWHPELMEQSSCHEVIALGDIFLPDEIEALLLTYSRTLEEAFPELTQLGPLVVIKRGAKGAIAVDQHGIVEMPAIPVQPVDTTGAGDCFNAGFLYGWLQGWPLSRCLQAGNICGGLSTTSPGGSTASPALAELTGWLNNENER